MDKNDNRAASKKVNIREMFGLNQTPAGKAALRRAMEYAAKEQQKILDAAKKLK